MKTTDLTPQQRIEILEDVLKKLESGNENGGLCGKIKGSAYELFGIFDDAENIIPIFTFENAKMITFVKAGAKKEMFWWYTFEYYDFKNRIKFVNWMINEYK